MCNMNHPTCRCGHDCDDHLDGYGCQIQGCACDEYGTRSLLEEPTQEEIARVKEVLHEAVENHRSDTK